jgi:putative tryptophan/tyrosine transport system substrate-binding protein
MDRRTFLTGITVVLGTAPAAEAQAAERVPRIAFLRTAPGESPGPSTTSASEAWVSWRLSAAVAADAFRQGLRELGYVEGHNIIVERQWGRGSTGRFPEFAAEVVRLNLDAIVAANDAAGHAAQRVTKTAPIVIPFMTDPVGDGFVVSLARPGGNITGLTNQSADLTAKRLQLLKEAIPAISRMAVLTDAADKSYRQVAREAEAAARALGVHPQSREVTSPRALEDAFEMMTRDSAGAVFVVGGTMLFANRARLAEHALKHRLPMMCWLREYVDGCLMSYSANLPDLFRRAATYVDKILKGAKPADLPIEQPTKFELVINLKTAKALGLTIPPSLLLRADEVIR